MSLQAVFFDVGNTLLREERSRFEIYADSARELGLDVDAERMRGAMKRAHDELPLVFDGAFRYSDPWFTEFIRRIFQGELGASQDVLASVTKALFQRFETASTFRLFPGIVGLLDELRVRGLSIGVISNWSARLPNVLAAMELSERFDFVLCSAIEEVEKPDAALFHRALERAGTAAADALHVGDHAEKDYDGARRAGIEAVLVDHDGETARRANGRTCVRGVSELRAYILERI